MVRILNNNDYLVSTNKFNLGIHIINNINLNYKKNCGKQKITWSKPEYIKEIFNLTTTLYIITYI